MSLNHLISVLLASFTLLSAGCFLARNAKPGLHIQGLGRVATPELVCKVRDKRIPHGSRSRSPLLLGPTTGPLRRLQSKVVERTPAEVLEEVVVVDDGSTESMESCFDIVGIDAAAREAKRIRILRHPRTLGLMVAKKTGGDAAKGDLIAFFDCHVSPQPAYHEELRRLIIENPKRIVVPAITDLDLNTWEETPTSGVNTKCYLTWQAEFDWFDL